MANAILARGGTSVTIPILGEGGDLAVARDTGKPNLNESDVGFVNPATNDNLNAQDSFQVTGMLTGSSAYADAKTLAEDLVKPRATTGTPLTLDLSDIPNLSTYDVAVPTAEALELTYSPGRREMVGVNLNVTVVGFTAGGPQDIPETITPNAGNGIQLTDGSNTATLDAGETVTRTVGRPGSKLQAVPFTNPHLYDKNDPANDVFELSGSFVTNTAESDAVSLVEDVVRPRRGQGTLELHFLDGLYGLDAYEVMPTGTQAVRTTYTAGETGKVDVPTLSLRVVTEST